MNFENFEETERERWFDEVVDNGVLSRGGKGKGCNWGFVGVDWREGCFVR